MTDHWAPFDGCSNCPKRRDPRLHKDGALCATQSNGPHAPNFRKRWKTRSSPRAFHATTQSVPGPSLRAGTLRFRGIVWTAAARPRRLARSSITSSSNATHTSPPACAHSRRKPRTLQICPSFPLSVYFETRGMPSERSNARQAPLRPHEPDHTSICRPSRSARVCVEITLRLRSSGANLRCAKLPNRSSPI